MIDDSGAVDQWQFWFGRVAEVPVSNSEATTIENAGAGTLEGTGRLGPSGCMDGFAL